jgi:hypothetical protein
MTKLTYYTSIEDLKASKSSFLPRKSDSERELELKEFIALLKDHSSPSEPYKSNKSLNQSGSGK